MRFISEMLAKRRKSGGFEPIIRRDTADFDDVLSSRSDLRQLSHHNFPRKMPSLPTGVGRNFVPPKTNSFRDGYAGSRAINGCAFVP